jgi:hypothetical protein
VMRRIRLWSFTLAGLLALFVAVPALHGQLRLAAQNSVLADTTITPPDPTVLATNDSPEILALDVPASPSSGYALFTSSVVWQLDATGNAPVRIIFQLRFEVTSPALPPGVIFRFGVPMLFLGNSSAGEDFLGGTTVDAEPLTRKLAAEFLLAENPSTLTAATAAQVADALFRQGFHVSVFARLRSRNVADATVSNPNVAFFTQPGSQEGLSATIGSPSMIPLTDSDQDDRRASRTFRYLSGEGKAQEISPRAWSQESRK